MCEPNMSKRTRGARGWGKPNRPRNKKGYIESERGSANDKGGKRKKHTARRRWPSPTAAPKKKNVQSKKNIAFFCPPQ